MSTESPITIRPYRGGDLEALVERLRELQEHECRLQPRLKPPSEMGAWYFEDFFKEAETEDGCLFVAERDGDIVGYASVLAKVVSEDTDEVAYEYAYISDVAVMPELRGQGLGRRLLDTCRDYARDAGATLLRITVLGRNEGAERLYRDFGFGPYTIMLEMEM